MKKRLLVAPYPETFYLQFTRHHAYRISSDYMEIVLLSKWVATEADSAQALAALEIFNNIEDKEEFEIYEDVRQALDEYLEELGERNFW